MTDIKKINIYMGVVGQAYVDKETAKKQMDAAAKNVVDVKYIIYLIDHSYETEFITLNDNNYSLTAQSYEEIATATLDNANEASQLAATVKQNIENALQSYEEGSQQYIELQALLDKLAANDTDGNYENGGNTASAQANIASINAFIVEIDDIKTTAQGLLTENQAYYDECVETFNNAKDEFESYVPEASEDQSDKNDELETALIERLNNVATGLETAQATTDAINQTSNEAQAAADEITQGGGGEEPEPETKLYYYVGTTKPTALSDANVRVVSEYPAEESYTNDSGAKSHIFVLTNEDKNVTFINPELHVPIDQMEIDTITIPGYNIFETGVGLADTGEIIIRIS